MYNGRCRRGFCGKETDGILDQKTLSFHCCRNATLSTTSVQPYDFMNMMISKTTKYTIHVQKTTISETLSRKCSFYGCRKSFRVREIRDKIITSTTVIAREQQQVRTPRLCVEYGSRCLLAFAVKPYTNDVAWYYVRHLRFTT